MGIGGVIPTQLTFSMTVFSTLLWFADDGAWTNDVV